jgi:hypothetical protein
MKKFKIHASYTTYLSATIEAENRDEAREIAYNMDGSDFKDTGMGDWNIDEIFEDEE